MNNRRERLDLEQSRPPITTTFGAILPDDHPTPSSREASVHIHPIDNVRVVGTEQRCARGFRAAPTTDSTARDASTTLSADTPSDQLLLAVLADADNGILAHMPRHMHQRLSKIVHQYLALMLE